MTKMRYLEKEWLHVSFRPAVTVQTNDVFEVWHDYDQSINEFVYYILHKGVKAVISAQSHNELVSRSKEI